MRGGWWLALLLFGCAAEVATTGELRDSTSEPIYDPVRELAAARAAPPRRYGDELVRRPMFLTSEPPPELPAFSAGELERIERVQPIVHAAAHQHGLPADIVNGIIWVESKFVPRALSRKGPRGLMQLMPRTGRELASVLGRDYEPYDPDFNIHAGSYYFARMVQRFDGNLRLALAAYNIGPAVVDRWLRDAQPLPDHSRAYVDNVFTAARTFRSHPL